MRHDAGLRNWNGSNAGEINKGVESLAETCDQMWYASDPVAVWTVIASITSYRRQTDTKVSVKKKKPCRCVDVCSNFPPSATKRSSFL